MNEFTLNDLREIMRSSAGTDEDVDLNGDILDVEFTEIGYDSLAVLELASQVQRKYGVPIPDETVAEMRTPRDVIEFITKQFNEREA